MLVEEVDELVARVPEHLDVLEGVVLLLLDAKAMCKGFIEAVVDFAAKTMRVPNEELVEVVDFQLLLIVAVLDRLDSVTKPFGPLLCVALGKAHGVVMRC